MQFGRPVETASKGKVDFEVVFWRISFSFEIRTSKFPTRREQNCRRKTYDEAYHKGNVRQNKDPPSVIGFRDRMDQVRGSKVLVVGSAPTFDSSLDIQSYDLVVSANGAAGQLAKLGISPHLTFMTSRLFSEKCDEDDWHEVKSAIGPAKASRGLVVVRNGFHFERRENFARFDYLPHEVTTVGVGRVRRNLARVTRSRLAGTAPHGLPSMGVLATAFLALRKASSITLSGFSLTTSVWSDADHFYDLGRPGPPVRPRNHSAADLLVLSSLAIRGFDIRATELEMQAALANWSIKGATWYQKSLKARIFWSRFAPW